MSGGMDDSRGGKIVLRRAEASRNLRTLMQFQISIAFELSWSDVHADPTLPHLFALRLFHLYLQRDFRSGLRTLSDAAIHRCP
jgi:hypothetical protein